MINDLRDLEFDELEDLQEFVNFALGFRREDELTTDLEERKAPRKPSEPTLADDAREVLEDLEIKATLADLAMLSSVILAESYHQADFNSRDINDTIEECGRPRIAHITSALGKLLENNYLSGSTKSITLPPEGKAKARALVTALRRKAKMAA